MSDLSYRHADDLDLDLGLDAPAAVPRGAPGKVPATARLSPAPVVFRVADPATARALGEALHGGGRGPLPRDVDPATGRGADGVAAGAEAAVERAAGSSGARLPAPIQRRFEASLGADLSGVRIHTDGASQAAAHAVGAHAYTVGQDVHFGAGKYQPDDPFGLHLLAHEVAHTVQQAGGAAERRHKLEVSAPQDAAEHEADRAADAMVRGEPASIAGGGVARSRGAAPLAREADPAVPPVYKFALGNPPLAPGVVHYESLAPVAAAVKAEGGGVPNPGGLFDAAESNFNRFAAHATNVQAYYHAATTGIDLAPKHYFAEFAAAAGKAHKFCETGAAAAGAASGAVGNWAPALTSSGERWKAAKDTAEAAGIDAFTDLDGAGKLDDEGVAIEGDTLQGTVKNVLPQAGELPADATAEARRRHEQVKKADAERAASGQNVRLADKVMLDEATTNFEQSMAEVTGARSGVVTARGRAAASLSAAKVAANSERLEAAQDKKAEIDATLARIEAVQAAIEKGMGLVNEAEGLDLLTDAGSQVSGTRIAKIAEIVLRLDGTLPAIEGEIEACTTAGKNLTSVINTTQIAADGAAYTAAIGRYRQALAVVPERMKKYQAAHKAFAEAVNQALIKRGDLKPGGDGVTKTMALLADLRIALAATTSAISATHDVSASIATVASLTSPPQPDICGLKDLVASHSRAFGTAPGHVAAILAVLTARESRLSGYIERLAV